MWEAQFGDFVNGAQVITDQFITSGESKWNRSSGLVMLLPHGYEGQGPEHSSARLERFLQLCAEDNIQVCNFTTPANYFHALRRQVKRNFRKPLIVMTPKSLLRLPAAASRTDDFTRGRFLEVIGDTTAKPGAVTRVVLCSGKVYYELAAKRDAEKAAHVAVVRLEQFYPWPEEQLKAELARYTKCQGVRLVPGGAAQQRRLVLRRAAAAVAGGEAVRVRRPGPGRESVHGVAVRPQARADGTRRGRDPQSPSRTSCWPRRSPPTPRPRC